MRQLELRRHATRDPGADRLSPAGVRLAEEVGRSLAGPYDATFVSPARRAAETLEAFARTAPTPLPAPAVAPGLLGQTEDDRTPERLAAAVRELLAGLPEAGRGLAVGHHPLIERAVEGLTGQRIRELAECEGVLLTEERGGALRLVELRRSEG